LAPCVVTASVASARGGARGRGKFCRNWPADRRSVGWYGTLLRLPCARGGVVLARFSSSRFLFFPRAFLRFERERCYPTTGQCGAGGVHGSDEAASVRVPGCKISDDGLGPVCLPGRGPPRPSWIHGGRMGWVRRAACATIPPRGTSPRAAVNCHMRILQPAYFGICTVPTRRHVLFLVRIQL
jgi:hypothetical protein